MLGQPRILFLAVLWLLAACQAPGWREDLRQRLPRLGHRNVIAVVDSAYPAQTSPGITTIHIGGDQLPAVAAVLAAIRDAGHVAPKICLDQELADIAEIAAPGITAYRERLQALLAGAAVVRQPHEQVINSLDAAGKQFEVLVLKTDLRLPYTSVFVWLDCGYWDGQREAALRANLVK